MQGPYLPDAELSICFGRISNKPPVDANRRLTNFAPLIVVNQAVILASAPANNACLSSGFGPRNGRPHEGIDLRARPASMVFSAGPGLIREVSSARGYGKLVVIDHGSGVSTRYAHLDNFAPGIVAGAQIGFGQPLGIMGDTGNATAVHLHYEVLLGEWGPGTTAFDLRPTNPLEWPAYWPDEFS